MAGFDLSSDIERVLEDITNQRIKRRGLGRLYTLKILCGHGKDWTTPGQIMKELAEYGTHTNYVFELGVRYPQLVEMSQDKKLIRVQAKAYPELRGLIDKSIESAQKALSII